MSSAPSTALLCTHPLLNNADEAALEFAARHIRYRRYAARDVIARHGDDNSQLLLVMSGHLQASRVCENGHQVAIGTIKSGDSIGASAILLDTPLVASVIAVTSSLVGVMDRPHARTLFAYPSVTLSLLSALSSKLHDSVERQSTLAMPNAQSRVYAVINAALTDPRRDGNRPVALPEQASLAMEANVSRETVSRTMKALVERGVISREGRSIMLNDRQTLQRLATSL